MNKMSVVIIMVLVTSLSGRASDILWGNNTEIYKVWDGGLILNGDTNYVIRLYESADNAINFPRIPWENSGEEWGVVGSGGLGDDTYTGIQFNWNGAGEDGFCYWVVYGADTAYGLNTGDKFYSVIFDTSYGLCAIVDDAPATVSYSASPGWMNYNPGGVIPEPATALLLGIGGMAVWFGRRHLVRLPGQK